MAEAYLKKFGGADYDVESAGLEPSRLNPLVVEAMMEDGIDISTNPTKEVFELHRQGKTYDVVITVCDDASAARCPAFPGKHEKIAWSFDDPSSFGGTHGEKLSQTRAVRDVIKQAVLEFVTLRQPV
jgi:arsenate reductase (thioredoxin)